MDGVWWRHYGEEAAQTFKGERWAPVRVPGVHREVFDPGQNSGAGAIALAARWGATRIILLGYDCQLTGGRTHWHGDHPEGLGNAGVVNQWPSQFAALAARLKGVEIVNCSRETALRRFPREPLEVALSSQKKPALFVEGMHGLGDNLHQRSVMRQLMRDYDVWLETPWPCLYHDMPDLKLISKGSVLRTQAKNAQREADRFTKEPPPAYARRLKVNYPPDAVRQHGAALAAMSAQCGVRPGDFRLPIPDEWFARADQLIAQWQPSKPLMIYRPLVERTEWGGCRNRNPSHAAYGDLFKAIRDRFFVVSVADLVPRKEWMVGPAVDADVTYHGGELDIEILAALTARAGLVYTAPGFALVLAQAVGTPVVGVFGGYEKSSSFSAGAAYTPTLGIDTIKPCDCFSHSHRCEKRIDMPSATRRLLEFVHEHTAQPPVR